jgi:hypothetical protein
MTTRHSSQEDWNYRMPDKSVNSWLLGACVEGVLGYRHPSNDKEAAEVALDAFRVYGALEAEAKVRGVALV